MTHTEPATLPPPGLAGLDPTWSRLVTATDGDGIRRTWHVFDNWSTPAPPRLTLLCVHGNPSWSYLFRELLATAPDDVRVVAVDHLDMGFSERTGTLRRLATRIDDLDRVSAELGVTGPTVTVAHDWGGPISLGWAQRHRDQLRGVVLMNTAVHQPASSPAPSVIRLVRSTPMLRVVTTSTTAFIRGAFELSDRRPDAANRDGFLAPYRTADRRTAIGEFVADIPLEPEHPSASTLDALAAGLADFGDVPVLLLWGAADRVFSDLYLHDLEARLPHADVHRYPTAGHFVSEDTDCLSTALTWIGDLDAAPTRSPNPGGSPSTLLDIPTPPEPRLAVAEMTPDRPAIGTREFDALVDATATGLAADGIRPGDRVALMIPPGIELSVTLLACWRAGAVAVLIDSGLGRRGMSAAMKSAAPDHLIGIPKALAAARALRWPGRRICTVELGRASRLAIGVDADLPTLRSMSGTLPDPVDGSEIAAVAFTSGATGPSKGVLYTHDALAAQRDTIASLYDITADDRLVAAFAPFALYGPLLGIPSVIPDMDVAAPGTLTAPALGEAVLRVRATLAVASPAALSNVVRTADQLTPTHRAAFDNVRLLLSAGAPVRPALLRATCDLFPNATASTPYGMTECLPVSNISLDEIDQLAAAPDTGYGVCVGLPLPSVDVSIRPLGSAPGELTVEPGVVGEIVVRAPHQRFGYDRLWRTEHDTSRPDGWHATGDVGHLDEQGRLWVGGRIGHVMTSPAGPITPVALEQRVESIDRIELAAAVGVGPTGTQQVVVVIQRSAPVSSARLADTATHDLVRSVVDGPVAAVFDVPALPVDRRHNSKIDRTALAAWATEVLAGGRITDP